MSTIKLKLNFKKNIINDNNDNMNNDNINNNDIIDDNMNNKCALSLFSGAGGDTLGMKMSGINVKYFSENNKWAINTHLNAFSESKLIEGDIRKISDNEFIALKGKCGLIFAGFPCQGFSNAGKKNLNDPRNELVYEFLRATKLINPKWIIGENVKGILTT